MRGEAFRRVALLPCDPRTITKKDANVTMLLIKEDDLKVIERMPRCCQRVAFNLLRSLGYQPADANAIAFERKEDQRRIR